MGASRARTCKDQIERTVKHEIMKKLTWDSFTKKIHIKVSIELLYQSWTTEKGICSWFLKDATYEREDKKLANEAEVDLRGFELVGYEFVNM